MWHRTGRLRRIARLRRLHDGGRRLRRWQMCVQAPELRGPRRAVRKSIRRLRAGARVRRLRRGAFLWRRRSESLWHHPVRSGDVRIARQELRSDLGRVRRDPVVRRQLPDRADVRRRRRGQPVRVRPQDVRAARRGVRHGRRRVRPNGRLRRLRGTEHLRRWRRCEPVRLLPEDVRVARRDLWQSERRVRQHPELRRLRRRARVLGRSLSEHVHADPSGDGVLGQVRGRGRWLRRLVHVRGLWRPRRVHQQPVRVPEHAAGERVFRQAVRAGAHRLRLELRLRRVRRADIVQREHLRLQSGLAVRRRAVWKRARRLRRNGRVRPERRRLPGGELHVQRWYVYLQSDRPDDCLLRPPALRRITVREQRLRRVLLLLVVQRQQALLRAGDLFRGPLSLTRPRRGARAIAP